MMNKKVYIEINQPKTFDYDGVLITDYIEQLKAIKHSGATHITISNYDYGCYRYEAYKNVPMTAKEIKKNDIIRDNMHKVLFTEISNWDKETSEIFDEIIKKQFNE